MPPRQRSCSRRSGGGRDLYLPRRSPYMMGGIASLHDIPGLVMLFDPAVAVDLVSGDASRLPNTAALGASADLVQGSAGARPTLVASDSDFAGKPSLSYNGTTDYLSTAGAVTPWHGTTCTLFSVSRGTTSGNHRIFGQDWSGTTGVTLIRSSTDVARAIFASGGINTLKGSGIGAAVTHIQVASFDVSVQANPIPTYLVNGTNLTSYTGGTTNAPAIGAIPTARWASGGLAAGGGEFFGGKIAIAGAFSRALSLAEATLVADYLRRRYT